MAEPGPEPEPGHAPPRRLRDEEVRERLARLEQLLALVEQTPGPAGELAASAVTELAQVYGEALARAVGHAADSPALLDALVRDELIGHLLVLHDIHPEPIEPRVARVIEQLKPAVAERGGGIALQGIEQGVATVALTLDGCGCGSSAAGLSEAVREAVLAVAPELTDVVVGPGERAGSSAAFVPLASVGVPVHAGGSRS